MMGSRYNPDHKQTVLNCLTHPKTLDELNKETGLSKSILKNVLGNLSTQGLIYCVMESTYRTVYEKVVVR